MSALTIDRSILPAWANKAVAMDADGVWFCYDMVPSFKDELGWLGYGECVQIPLAVEPVWHGDWKDTLIVFEEGEE